MTDEVGSLVAARQRPTEPRAEHDRGAGPDLLDAQMRLMRKLERAGPARPRDRVSARRRGAGRAAQGRPGPDPARGRRAARLRQDDALRGPAADRAARTGPISRATSPNTSRARCAGGSPTAIEQHRLRREIVATWIANSARQSRPRRVRLRARGRDRGGRWRTSRWPTSPRATASGCCRSGARSRPCPPACAGDLQTTLLLAGARRAVARHALVHHPGRPALPDLRGGRRRFRPGIGAVMAASGSVWRARRTPRASQAARPSTSRRASRRPGPVHRRTCRICWRACDIVCVTAAAGADEASCSRRRASISRCDRALDLPWLERCAHGRAAARALGPAGLDRLEDDLSRILRALDRGPRWPRDRRDGRAHRGRQRRRLGSAAPAAGPRALPRPARGAAPGAGGRSRHAECRCTHAGRAGAARRSALSARVPCGTRPPQCVCHADPAPLWSAGRYDGWVRPAASREHVQEASAAHSS